MGRGITNWQPLYVPFDFKITSDLLTQFEFAKYGGTYTDAAGEFFLTIVHLNEGDQINANVPYFIKAKTADTEKAQVISVDNASQKETVSNSLVMYSAEKKVSITGIYNQKTAASDNEFYAYSSGKYSPSEKDQKLGAFRFYLTIEDRDDNPYATPSANPASIKVIVIGEEDEPDAVETLDLRNEAETEAPVYYDLSGKRVDAPTRGIYIRNGRKVFLK